MCLGALIDVGVPLAYLTEQLGRLGISDEYRLYVESVHRNGQMATKLHVQISISAPSSSEVLVKPQTASTGLDHQRALPEHQQSDVGAHHGVYHHSGAHAPTRHLSEIERLIRAAGLSPQAEIWSLAVFRRLAEAEGAVHGISPEQVHFHEVGATDAIVDIVGTCLGFDWLGVDQLYCSALPTGGGTVHAAHGQLPVPVPAVLKLWEMHQIPIYSNGIDRELVTPTGAAIATTLATQFGSPPAMTLQRVGLGAGSRDLPIPNILRLWVGTFDQASDHDITQRRNQSDHPDHPKSQSLDLQKGDRSLPLASDVLPSLIAQDQKPPIVQHPSAIPPHSHDKPNDTAAPSVEAIALLQTQIDDLNPQAIGYLFDRLFSAGALDVFTQPIGMKKSRPGVLLSVICLTTEVEHLESLIFGETTTLGIRRNYQERAVLHREFQQISTLYGEVQLKVARVSPTGVIVNVQPEYEDCANLARKANVPWREIYHLAQYQWHAQHAASVSHLDTDKQTNTLAK